MSLNDSSERFVASNEGCRLTAYLDPAGVPTVGYGSTIYNNVPVKLGTTITQTEAEVLLHNKCDEIKMHLFSIIQTELDNDKVDALVDFCYNLGIYNFLTSTLYKVIENGQIVTEDLFTRWDRMHKDGVLVEVPGLLARRGREFLRFSGGL